MGILKSMKDMKQMVAAAPAMIDQAQVLQAQAAQMQAAQAQAAQQAQAAAFAAPGSSAGITPDLLAPVAGVTVEQYVAVVKGIAAYNYDQAMLPTVAAGHGIDRASWDTAAAAFNARVTSSPAFAQHFNALYRAS
ncbi:MAG: hypothetical protein HZB15_12105 [Actinobacteria bacterium]|nr:hypothetical protein [Actinomycetota bacterium]